MNILSRLINKFKETNVSFLFSKSHVRCKGKMTICKDVKIGSSKIYVDEGSSVYIGSNVKILNANIVVVNGSKLIIEDYSIIRCNHSEQKIEIICDGSNCKIEHHTLLQCARIWSRFGGKLNIGSYCNINSGSEIRCDEEVTIGDYTQISYNVRIWDTNTHKIYSPCVRRKLTMQHFPAFGKEIEKPSTRPVHIGSDCWLGERCAILKGTILGNQVSVGFNTIVSNKIIKDNCKVVSKNELTILD